MRINEIINEDIDLSGYSSEQRKIIAGDEYLAMDHIGSDGETIGPIIEPVSKVKNLAINTRYWEKLQTDPEEIERTNNIMQVLKSGEKQLPIWVLVNDFETFGNPRLYEGFHRLAAAMELKLQTIPVCYIAR
jgi:hypothetical protein